MRFAQALGILLGIGVIGAATPAAAAYEWHDCVISKVQLIAVSPGTSSPRVGVECTASTAGGISWFSFLTQSDIDHAKMLLSTLTAAKIAGRSVTIGFEGTDTSGSSWGCNAADCRPILQVIMH